MRYLTEQLSQLGAGCTQTKPDLLQAFFHTTVTDTMADTAEYEQVEVPPAQEEPEAQVNGTAPADVPAEDEQPAPEQVEAPAADQTYDNQPAPEQSAPAETSGGGVNPAFAAAQAQAAALAAKFSEEGSKRKFDDNGDQPEAKRAHTEASFRRAGWSGPSRFHDLEVLTLVVPLFSAEQLPQWHHDSWTRWSDNVLVPCGPSPGASLTFQTPPHDPTSSRAPRS